MTALDTLASVLRGETPADLRLTHALVDLAEAHGVEALLARSAFAATAPPDVAARATTMLKGYEALGAIRDRELRRVLDRLAAGGVRAVVIKGAHLAYTIYPSPALRPREDTDLVVAAAEQAETTRILEALGYRRTVHVRGALILGQCHFRRADDLGIDHALDIHWRLVAPLVFRHVLPADALRESSVAIPSLGTGAFGPALPHALIVACLHLVAHHREDPVLLWLHDIAALARTLDDRAAALFGDAAAAAGISAVCAFALARTRAYFDSPELSRLAARADADARSRPELSARLLSAARPIDEMWLDLRASDGWRERILLMKEHLWPDAAYMRAVAGQGGWLPFAYARRALLGARKWTSPSATRRTGESGGPPADSEAGCAFPCSSRTSR